MVGDYGYREVFDPASFSENGRASVFTAVGGAAGAGGFWNLGPGARRTWTGSTRRARLLVYSTGLVRQPGLRITNNAGTVQRDVVSSDVPVTNGYSWCYFDRLPKDPAGASKIELFVGGQHALSAGGPAQGTFPVAIEFDGKVTPVAPVTTGNHLVLIADSIPVGGNAVIESQLGFAGLMRRPVALGGYNGRVTLVGHGYAMIRDDMNGAPAQAAFAAFINSLGPTKIGVGRIVNDWLAGGGTAAATQAMLAGFLNALSSTASAAVPVILQSPWLTGVREGTGASGDNMDAYRAAIANCVTGGSAGVTKTGVTHLVGKTVHTTADIAPDGIHLLGLGGHPKAQTAWQAVA
ncbi:hypothetical protein [Sphingomonas immobilis]|uniref:Sialate O-acetylesterase domain-containing protein n=1 Tax=Sphingomonas immobilis TaxID=3063997 RepID=A0ABT9A0W0_9SPHN|nr:hypothetical protein [Sphingomonas sp. CA1-15]MDO7843465.1 hypothetical protein [Sphingomonas sp. CA1-15]